MPSSSAHPLVVGSRVAAISKSGGQPGEGPRPCDVIERRAQPSSDGAAERFSYYVHYIGTDRRLDEWVGEELIVLEAAAATSALPNAAKAEPMRRATRNMKRRNDEINCVQSVSSYDEALEREHEESTKVWSEGRELTQSSPRTCSELTQSQSKPTQHEPIEHPLDSPLPFHPPFPLLHQVKNIESIEIGRFELDAWYFSPYPDVYGTVPKLYLCEYTLKYMRKRAALEAHRARETRRAPPGTLIYRKMAPPLSQGCVDAGLEQAKSHTYFPHSSHHIFPM